MFKDYKTALQEIIQRNPEESVTYILTGENGPDHDKSFTVEVRLNSNVIGTGTGKNKKQAEHSKVLICTVLDIGGLALASDRIITTFA